MPSTKIFNGWLHRGFYIRVNNFARAKQAYETTLPIQGKRLKLGADIRPAGARRHLYEAYIKEGDNYGVGFMGSHFGYDKDGNVNSITVTPNPLLMFSPDGTMTFTPQWMRSWSTWEFLSAALPETIKFVKLGAKQYFRTMKPDGQYADYFISGMTDKMRFVPYESGDKTFYDINPEDIQRETRVLIDRIKAKVVREETKAFLDYFQTMSDLMAFSFINSEGDVDVSWQVRESLVAFLQETDWLIREEGQEIGEHWPEAVRALLGFSPTATWTGNKMHYALPTVDKLKEMPRERWYKFTRPYQYVQVPVGVSFHGNNR